MPNWITPGPDRADLKPALDMLGKAKRPILIVGLGVYWCGASAEFVKFAERLGAPVLTTTKCKGVIPEDHVLRAGCIIGGLIERKLVMEADLIVTVGLDAVELQPKPWPYVQPVLSVSSVPSVDALVPSDPEIIGDLKALLAALALWASEGTNWGEKAAKAFRQEVRDALKTYLDSYHGKAFYLGDAKTAVCTDCHGGHRILAPSDPESSVNQANLVETCSQCHPEANENFVRFMVHVDPTSPRSSLLVWTFYAAYIMLIAVVFTFGAAHSGLYIYRGFKDGLYSRRRSHKE